MRTLADLQRDPSSSPAAPEGLGLDVQRVRTFDTPEFAGMTFLEVETKTALNRVQGMPFPWSINPYRGCSHACSYCLSGDTPILMADGRTRPLAQVRPGDRVYGTRRLGQYRRYTITEVLDHWSSTKPAYRIRLADGTELIASGDHRFLTDRGWKHVTGAGYGDGQRRFLTTNNKLMGVGGFADPPKHDADYRRGYLCGMIRGDGHLGAYSYERPGRAHGDVYRFRLALADEEALARSASYLDGEGVPTQHFLFSPTTEQRRGIHAIRTSTRAGVEAVRRLTAWPEQLRDAWCKGFLAGVFDAEGSCGGDALRFSNTDKAILEYIQRCLSRFGFRWVAEPQVPPRCSTVRLLGGLPEKLRFFLTVDPAITRKRQLDGIALKSNAPLDVVAIEPVGIDMPMYDITTGTGDFVADGVVSHNCFARPTHAYLNMSPLADFERRVVVKTNLVEVLRRELVRPSWIGEPVAMGTNTDPYQRCEGRYRLMPGVIDTLAEFVTPFSILTKGTLITRDVPRLVAAAQRVDVSAALTIGMLDEDLWRASEPGTPSPRARLEAVRALNEAGIPTGVMLAPIMPGLSDGREQLAALVDAAAAAGATHITPIVLHLRRSGERGRGGPPRPPAWRSVREVFWPWLRERHPELVARYEELYTGAYAAADYRKGVERFVADQRRAAWRRHGHPQSRRPRRSAPRQPPAAAAGTSGPDPPRPPGEQLRLW